MRKVEVEIKFDSYLMKGDTLVFEVESIDELKEMFKEWCISRNMDQETKFKIIKLKGK